MRFDQLAECLPVARSDLFDQVSFWLIVSLSHLSLFAGIAGERRSYLAVEARLLLCIEQCTHGKHMTHSCLLEITHACVHVVDCQRDLWTIGMFFLDRRRQPSVCRTQGGSSSLRSRMKRLSS